MGDDEAVTDAELNRMSQATLLTRWKALDDKSGSFAQRLILRMTQDTMRKAREGN